MLGTCELNRDMFLTKQDVRVLFGKLAQETYQLHKNDVKSVYVGSTKHQFNVLLSRNWGTGGWWFH
jgi:hypothetical protein